MARALKWSPKAASNLEEICEFIGEDSAHYAFLFARKVVALVKTLPVFPESGRIVPEYGDPNLREKIYNNYRIVYRIREDAIEIVAICHGARLLSNVL